jgi:hypothetical protein
MNQLCRPRTFIITILVLSLIFVSWKLYERLSIDHYSPTDFISSFSSVPEMVTPTTNTHTTFVTAYYTIPNKYGDGKTNVYLDWITNFIKFSRKISLVIFSTGKDLVQLQEIVKGCSNIYFVDLPMEQFFVYSYVSELEKQKSMDHEKNIHSVELYMIWNEKAYFIKRAMSLSPFNSSHYCWIDIGVVRDPQLSSVILDFPDQSGLDFLYRLNKICVIGIEPNNLSKYKSIDKYGISEINRDRPPVSVAGGFVFGSKEQFEIYIERYYKLFKEYINQGVFVGKEQNLMTNLIINHTNDFVVLDTHKIKTWLNPFQKNYWFNMINLLSKLKPFIPMHTPTLMGGLGNQLFILASVYGIARKRGEILVLNSISINDNPHSSEIYLDTIFKRFLKTQKNIPYYTKVMISLRGINSTYQESYSHAYDPKVLKVPASTYEFYSGYFQNYKYFEQYLDELRLLLDLPNVPETNQFFIHIRLGDYVNNRNHYIDLKQYYKTCISQIKNQYGDQVKFCVFTNDQQLADNYLKNNLPDIKYTFGDKSETLALAQMSQCSLGGVCANSTFSWWGSMLNPRKNKKIFFPSKMYPDTSIYRDYDVSGLFHPDFTIITI